MAASRRWGNLGRIVGTCGLLGAVLGCDPAPTKPGAAPPQTDEARPTELDAAVARYHTTGEIDALRTWVDQHTDHEDAEVWREVVALRIYESIVIGDLQAVPEALAPDEDPAIAPLPAADPKRLLALAARYPDTIGGQSAQTLLEEDGLRRLGEPAINPVLIRFLDGDETWAEADGGIAMPNVDLIEFRDRHEDRLRGRFAVRLLQDGCATTLEYCNWWVARYPEDHLTREIQAEIKQVWHRRAHPPWRGRDYATCAVRCAKRCKQAAAPLDDSCYEPCFSRCG